jgi:hypothetical protein
VSPLQLKALVNHALPRDVTTGYVQMTTEALRPAAQKVANKFKKLCGTVPVVEKNVATLKRSAA